MGRRHPSGRVIAIMWACLFVAAFVGAVVFQDDDPTTDDGAAWGALLAFVGGALTAVYVLGSEVVVRRRGSHAAESAKHERPGLTPSETVPETRPPRLRPRTVVLAVVAALVVLGAAAALDPTGGDDEPAGTRESDAPDAIPDPAAAIQAAAARGSDAPILSVDCPGPVSTESLTLGVCAVTFAGPSCQLWIAGGVDEPEPLPLGDPLPGKLGHVSEQGVVRCA